jgi:hypothetical protein
VALGQDAKELAVVKKDRRASARHARVATPSLTYPDGEPELARDLARLRELLEKGSVEEARRLVNALERQWPDAERVRHFVQVLAPPVASVRPDLRWRPLDRERAWLREHAASYPGRWLAVLEDRLIAADPSLRVVLTIVRQTPGGEGALLHFQPGSVE